MEELEKQAQRSMSVLITAAFVLLGFALSLEELAAKDGKLEPVTIFGVKLPSAYTPLLLLLVMAAALLYLASTCSAMIHSMKSGEPRGKAGAWLFFHPGRQALVLGFVWVFAAPALHLLVLARFIALFGRDLFETAGDIVVMAVLEPAIFVGLVVLARWTYKCARSAREIFLSLPPSGSRAEPAAIADPVRNAGSGGA